MAKYRWRRDYGDGYETDDSVLWIEGKPTDHCVSPISTACYFAFIDNKEVGMFDTREEAKKYILAELGLK